MTACLGVLKAARRGVALRGLPTTDRRILKVTPRGGGGGARDSSSSILLLLFYTPPSAASEETASQPASQPASDQTSQPTKLGQGSSGRGGKLERFHPLKRCNSHPTRRSNLHCRPRGANSHRGRRNSPNTYTGTKFDRTAPIRFEADL